MLAAVRIPPSAGRSEGAPTPSTPLCPRVPEHAMSWLTLPALQAWVLWPYPPHHHHTVRPIRGRGQGSPFPTFIADLTFPVQSRHPASWTLGAFGGMRLPGGPRGCKVGGGLGLERQRREARDQQPNPASLSDLGLNGSMPQCPQLHTGEIHCGTYLPALL